MDNSGNNIKLEIEMTNRERGDSIISDIETALDIPQTRNKTLTEDEIKAIDKCNDTYEKYEWIIKSSVTVLGIVLSLFMIYVLIYGAIHVLKLLINY